MVTTIWWTDTRPEAVNPPDRAWRIAASVPDPDLRGLSLGQLGLIRDVTEDDQSRVHVTIDPARWGAASMDAVRLDVIEALTLAGFLHVDVEFEPEPAEPRVPDPR